MPEPPDFDSMARELWPGIAGHAGWGRDEDAIQAIVEQLRQAWNARGAADLDAIEAAHAYTLEIGGAVRTLDR